MVEQSPYNGASNQNTEALVKFLLSLGFVTGSRLPSPGYKTARREETQGGSPRSRSSHHSRSTCHCLVPWLGTGGASPCHKFVSRWRPEEANSSPESLIPPLSRWAKKLDLVTA